jgi:hypothetical protein
MFNKPFDFVKEITSLKRSADIFDENDWKLFNPFFINKSLSFNPVLLEIIDFIQCLKIDDKKQLYKIYCELIPVDKKYYPFLKKDILIEDNEEIINILKEYFEISYNEMKDCLKLLSKDNIEKILEIYGFNSKEIKKMLKKCL